MSEIIKVRDLSKTFSIRKNYPGITGALRSIFCPKTFQIEAIHSLSFSIAKGERVAFIGPNGAGKSTTIKMLTGILHPTSGFIEVLGLTPWKNRRALGFQIGTVFGQRTQLWYHLPPSDTFDLLAKIYELDSATYKRQLDYLTEVFELSHLLHKPVRQLSLGERMRCEIACSLLHNPKIIFLDEPTIGLDINAKLRIRSLLKKQDTTLFLTSHDTADIEEVCDRVIILDKGSLLLDNSLAQLKKSYVKRKILTIITDEEKLSLTLPGMKILENANYHFVCEVTDIPIEKVIHEALKLSSLKDVTIEDPSMEEIIRTLYAKIPGRL